MKEITEFIDEYYHDLYDKVDLFKWKALLFLVIETCLNYWYGYIS